MAHIGVSIADIPRYVSPTQPVSKPRRITKNQKYPVKMLAIPQGMPCMTDIVPMLMVLKYADHDLLASTTITEETYEPMVAVGGI